MKGLRQRLQTAVVMAQISQATIAVELLVV
jgi:hypothetical protein